MMNFLSVLLMVYTFRNLLGLLESAIMLWTSTCEININSQTSPTDIGIKNCAKHFLNFIADTMN